MSEETWADSIPATAWWSTGADNSGILDLLEDQLLGVVEASLIDGLTEQLARRLGTESIELRHVHVVDEEDHLLTAWWSKKSLSLGLEVALKGILQVLGGGLTREVDAGRDDFRGSSSQEIFGND